MRDESGEVRFRLGEVIPNDRVLLCSIYVLYYAVPEPRIAIRDHLPDYVKP